MDHHHSHHKHDQGPKQENPSPVVPNNKLAGDQKLTKRDEWSEGAVSCLLDAYEEKWGLRNRAKLKGQDWEDVAKFVSSRGRGGEAKSPKTMMQCKNKIESMKKRYRSESAVAGDAAAAASSWPLFSKLDHLLRGNGASAACPVSAVPPPPSHSLSPLPPLPLPLPLPPSSVVNNPIAPPQQPPTPQVAPNSHGSNAVDLEDKQADGVQNTKSSDDKNSDNADTDGSTPTLCKGSQEKMEQKEDPEDVRVETKRKRRKRWRGEVGEIMKWVGDAVGRWEKMKMETIREVERMRAEVEQKRGEMELRRTQIVASTQLEIAKLFANSCSSNSSNAAKGGIGSSLRIGRN